MSSPLDQRGHGLSDNPGSYTFAEVTADLAAFIDALGLERPVIAGHSWGGGVAAQFAANYPDIPSAIALVDGGFVERSSFEASWEQAEVMMRPPEIDGVPVDTFVGFAKKWPDVAAIWNDQLQDMILSNLEVRDGKVYRRLPIPDHMKIAHEIWHQDTSELWPRIRCPVLMVPAIKQSDDPRAGSVDAREASGHRDGEESATGRSGRADGGHHPRCADSAPEKLAAAIIEFAGND